MEKFNLKCKDGCTYSKAMDQKYPRECIYCGSRYVEGERTIIQPKFEFGEKVIAKNGKIFIVSDVRRDAECGYVYNEDRSSEACFPESELELYIQFKEAEDSVLKDLRWALEKIMIMTIPSSNAHTDASRKLRAHFPSEVSPFFKDEIKTFGV